MNKNFQQTTEKWKIIIKYKIYQLSLWVVRAKLFWKKHNFVEVLNLIWTKENVSVRFIENFEKLWEWKESLSLAFWKKIILFGKFGNSLDLNIWVICNKAKKVNSSWLYELLSAWNVIKMFLFHLKTEFINF